MLNPAEMVPGTLESMGQFLQQQDPSWIAQFVEPLVAPSPSQPMMTNVAEESDFSFGKLGQEVKVIVPPLENVEDVLKYLERFKDSESIPSAYIDQMCQIFNAKIDDLTNACHQLSPTIDSRDDASTPNTSKHGGNSQKYRRGYSAGRIKKVDPLLPGSENVRFEPYPKAARRRADVERRFAEEHLLVLEREREQLMHNMGIMSRSSAGTEQAQDDVQDVNFNGSTSLPSYEEFVGDSSLIPMSFFGKSAVS